MATSAAVRTPKALYRYLIRKTALLPENTREHYRHRIKQEFHSYSDESDSERIRQIMDQAVKDSDWILQKYQKT